ncbi:MAG: hypothetical protein KDD60_05005, partial [Bdellovibrionales bacterium]|nr:hypothetical protein [Bdellovibrionales bacterium]
MSSLHPKFSHIYVERQALEHQRTEDLVKRLSKRETTKIIPITSYTEIFNRNKQNFAIQKDVQKYILALRQEDFLYAGSSAAPDFGNTNFYYNTLVLNCLYNCEYCYLQGMFRSAHLVVFVNNETFLAETEQALQRLGEMYVCLSYDTDLLAFENLLGYCKEWIEFTRVQTGLTIEIR